MYDIYTCTYTYMYVFICVCIYIYIHVSAEAESVATTTAMYYTPMAPTADCAALRRDVQNIAEFDFNVEIREQESLQNMADVYFNVDKYCVWFVSMVPTANCTVLCHDALC